MTLEDLAREILSLESMLRELPNTFLSDKEYDRLNAACDLQRLTAENKILGI